MQKNLFPVLGVILLFFVSPMAIGEVLQLEPSKDNTLYEDVAGGISNGQGEGLFMGRTGLVGDAELRRSVVAFDLTSVPKNAVINSVEVSFTINQAPMGATPDTATLHAMTRDWGEGASNAPGNEGMGTSAQAGDATWIHAFFDTVDWTFAGGDFEAVASASTLFGNSNPETMTFASTPQLLIDVQRWVNKPSTNFGWVLMGD
jgi:hypothetical protein